MCESNGTTQIYVFGHSVGEAQSIQQLTLILAPVIRQFLEQVMCPCSQPSWLVHPAGDRRGDAFLKLMKMANRGKVIKE